MLTFFCANKLKGLIKMKKIIIPVLCAALALSASAQASELSGWAEPEYSSANSAGLLPESIVSAKLTASITRAEFCEAVMNLYKIMGGKAVTSAHSPFTDTDSSAVKEAYTLGVINGKTDTLFYPNDLIKRQEMAKIIMRTINAADKDAHVTVEELENLHIFDDLGDADDWAMLDIAGSVKYEIINGVSKSILSPRGYATREQAIAIINRAYNAFCEEKATYLAPQFSGIKEGSILTSKLSFNWTSTPGAKEYTFIIKDSGYNHIATYNTASQSIDITDKGLGYNRNYTVLVGAKISEYITVFSAPVTIYYGSGTVSPLPTLDQRYNRVFPGGKAFTTEAEAIVNMRTISVPVWQLASDGTKYSASLLLVVNLNLADEVMQIFTEIYNSPEKFPIKNVGGYSFRTTAFGSVSQHSYGTCIDINFDENYYCYPSGEAIVGSFWKPYENPFSIPRHGSVVKTFSKYGWTWGGDWKNLKDYMHFSYLGK